MTKVENHCFKRSKT